MMATLSTLKPRIATIDTRVGSSAAVERIRGWKLTKIRDRVLLRDEYACQVCGRISATELIVDHVVPLAFGGQETDVNRQALCPACHDLKSAGEEKERS